MPRKEIVIIGAGKIGRGYLAELFQDAGYQITFMMRSPEQAASLRDRGSYTIYRASQDESVTEEVIISGYEAFGYNTERKACIDVLCRTNYVALPIYPAASKPTGQLLAEGIIARMERGIEEPLDVLICVNYLEPTKTLKADILAGLQTEAQIAYFEKYVGLIETLVSRLAVDPSAEILARDPNAVSAGYGPTLPADADSFKGEPLADVPGVQLIDKLPARFVYKIWTTNMMHFAMSLYGDYMDYTYVREAAADPYIIKCVRFAERESMYAVSAKYNIPMEEIIDDFKKDPWPTWANPASDDGFERVVMDMRRKLSKVDRVIGPALACIQHGRMPYYLARIAALALIYYNENDETSVELHKILEEQGIAAALKEFAELDTSIEEEKYLIQLINGAYLELLDDSILKEY